MKPIVNHLIQLQELIDARAQQAATQTNARLTGLDESIQSLMKELPQQVARKFRQLQKKEHIAIVPISNNVCSGCGMALPVSLVYEVRAGDKILTCPNCARMLFCPPKSAPRRIAQRQRRFAPAKVGVARFSAPTLMLPHVKATSRDDLIALLAQRLEENEFVDSAELLNEEALRREAIMSTAVEHGLAFPHVRGVEGGGLTLALATSKKGIRFNEDARGLTRIVFFVVIPTAASAFYLKLLAGLTESFQKKENREKILKAETEDKLWKALLTTTRTTVR